MVAPLIRWAAFSIGSAFLSSTPALGQSASIDALKTESTRCIGAAADFHKVNPSVLKAILKVESSFNSKAINRNQNGSLDVGIGQMNSIHFKELAKFGVAPNDLLDPCVGTYVAAWHLAKQLTAYGNTWFAIGSYHSATPYFNSRYQALIYNAMVDLNAATGPKLAVPAINANSQTAKPAKALRRNGDDILAISE
jgi:soluble lytic murein transglycosylase-like protein